MPLIWSFAAYGLSRDAGPGINFCLLSRDHFVSDFLLTAADFATLKQSGCQTRSCRMRSTQTKEERIRAGCAGASFNHRCGGPSL